MAAPIRFEFSATITNVDGALAGSFTLGQTISGAYRFESSTPDSAGDPATGLYFNAGTLFSVVKGVLSFSAATVNISVTNSPALDIYRVEGDGVTGSAVGAFGIHSLDFALTNNVAPVIALASDALPTVPPALANFNVRSFTLVFRNGATVASVGARVDSLSTAVPEPGLALPLFLLLAWATLKNPSSLDAQPPA